MITPEEVNEAFILALKEMDRQIDLLKEQGD
jgi:hypothetical protein